MPARFVRKSEHSTSIITRISHDPSTELKVFDEAGATEIAQLKREVIKQKVSRRRKI
jgi:hypothetical protein